MRTTLAVALVMTVSAPRAMADDGLTRADIAKAVASVKADVEACGGKAEFTGTVKLQIIVNPDGTVKATKDLTANGSIRDRLGACVMGVVRKVTFAKTAKGGSFTYPFVIKTQGPPDLPDLDKLPGATAHPPDPDVPRELERAHISDAMAKIKAKVTACGDASKAGGTVKANVKVAGNGTVTSVTAAGSTDAKLNTCVADAIKTATFAKTSNGGAFVYPFVFGSSTPKTQATLEPTAITGDLDKAAITDGVAKVKAKIAACEEPGFGRTIVGAKVAVAADGKVKSVTTDGLTGDKLKNCVADVMKTATFKATKNGGAFRYPFSFGKIVEPVDTSTANALGNAEPSALDRSMISDGIAKVKAAIGACGDSKTKGIVKLEVVVAPAGTVSSATVAQTPAEALGTCVAKAVSKATFARTEQGGTFTYPFVF